MHFPNKCNVLYKMSLHGRGNRSFRTYCKSLDNRCRRISEQLERRRYDPVVEEIMVEVEEAVARKMYLREKTFYIVEAIHAGHQRMVPSFLVGYLFANGYLGIYDDPNT